MTGDPPGAAPAWWISHEQGEPPAAAGGGRARSVRPASRSAFSAFVLLTGALVAGVLLAGCTAATDPAPASDEQASPFGDCAALTAAPPSAAPAALAGSSVAAPVPAALTGSALAGSALAGPAAPTGSAPATSEGGLPDLELPCFTGGQPVRLADVRGPAVINLWASWCEPCRTELPTMQGLADRAGGRLHVLGVDTGDGRDAAASFGASKNVTMPTLYDRNRELLSAVGRINLPITIFIDSAGRDYVHLKPLDQTSLSELVREHTGVTVAP